MATFLWFLITPAALLAPGAHCELIQNGGFENGLDPWFCQNTECNLSISSDSYQGSSSILVSDRTKKQGLAQFVNITADTRYNLIGYVKFLNLAHGEIFETVVMTMLCKDSNNDDSRVTKKFGKTTRIRKGQWTRVGDFDYIPAGYKDCRVYIQTNMAESNYLFDEMSLVEVPELTNWREEALARIESERKSNLKIKLVNSVPGNYTVEVKQTSHLFGFGSLVGAEQMTNSSYKTYQDFVYKNFEWATINDIKWKPMEKIRGEVFYDRADAVLNVLNDHGYKIRCHNVFWGFAKNTPDWVVELKDNVNELKAEMARRINYVVNFTKGRIEHWAVNNENLHDYWYARTLNDTEVTVKMFKDIHAVDSDVKLFLNDYGVMGINMATSMRNQALHLKASGAPIYGIGIQSHLYPREVDMTLVKYRLDTVTEAGLPIWITELTVNELNATLKARVLEDLMIMYFSYPVIKGINIWGFWDGRIGEPTAKLFEGPNLEPNEAGTAYLNLRNSWWTNENFVMNLISDTVVETVRGFKGDYSIVVKRDGEVVGQRTKTLDRDRMARFEILE